MDQDKKILVQCDCGSEILSFTKKEYKKTGEEIYISSYLAEWYTEQKPGWYSFLDRLKLIWNIFLGKKHYLFEIVLLDEKEIANFKQQMKEFIE